MSNEWKNEITEQLNEYRKERAEVVSGISSVLGEFSPTAYGVETKFNEIKPFPYTAQITLTFKGAGSIVFTVSKEILSSYNLVKEENGASRPSQPSNGEEIKDAFRKLILAEVKNK